MGIEIIQESYIEDGCEYRLEYNWRGETGWGFSFQCDENGVVFDPTTENYIKCTDGTHDVEGPELTKREWSYRHPAIGRCDCGEEVELDGFTCTCEGCGADYNSSGQRLAPRSQWGWDTGESVSDILRIK